MGKSARTSETAEGPRVCLLGRAAIQQWSLCEYLRNELGVECSVQADMETCISLACLGEQQTVLLFDCSYHSPATVLDHLRRNGALREEVVVPAMINLDGHGRFEREAVQSGVRGLFYSGDSPATLARGIRTLLAGEVWVSRKILMDAAIHVGDTSPTDNSERYELTRRETEILAMICVGARNEEIAEKLFISTNTVKTHIYNIYKKIHVPNRTQAALWAARHL